MRVPSSEAQDEPYFDFILNDNAQVLARALILCILYAARNKECVCVWERERERELGSSCGLRSTISALPIAVAPS